MGTKRTGEKRKRRVDGQKNERREACDNQRIATVDQRPEMQRKSVWRAGSKWRSTLSYRQAADNSRWTKAHSIALFGRRRGRWRRRRHEVGERTDKNADRTLRQPGDERNMKLWLIDFVTRYGTAQERAFHLTSFSTPSARERAGGGGRSRTAWFSSCRQQRQLQQHSNSGRRCLFASHSAVYCLKHSPVQSEPNLCMQRNAKFCCRPN